MGLSGVLARDGGDRHRDDSVFPTQTVDTAIDREEIIGSPSQLRAPLIDDGGLIVLLILFEATITPSSMLSVKLISLLAPILALRRRTRPT